MRAVLLAALVVTPAFLGCLGEEDPARHELPPGLPLGLVLTYEIEAPGEPVREESFVVHPVPGGYDLKPHRVSEPTESPFLRIGQQLTPRNANYTGLVQFPLDAGMRYDAEVGGEPVEVVVSALEVSTYPFGETAGLALVATNEAGEVLVTLHFLDEPPVFGLIELDAPDGTRHRWTLVDWSFDPLYSEPPLWDIGDHWTYEATWSGLTITPTMVYNANDTATGGSPVYVLNPTKVADRQLARVFHVVRMADLASQSGPLNGMLSKQWDWPLRDGKTWGGSTTTEEGDVPYTAAVSLETVTLPDGSLTTAYVMRAVTREGDHVATWDYAPRVRYFTNLTIEDPTTGKEVLAWRLTDFGTGFKGSIELPRRIALLELPVEEGPASFNRSFDVPEEPTAVELAGFGGWATGVSPANEVRLIDPSGKVVLALDQGDFEGDARRVQLNEFVVATPGNWTLSVELVEGASLFLNVLGHWTDVVEVDYSDA